MRASRPERTRLPPPVGVAPALCLVAGALSGTLTTIDACWPTWLLVAMSATALSAWVRGRALVTCLSLACGFFAGAAALAADARHHALEPPLRTLLDTRFGGFALSALGPESDHDPLVVTFLLVEDAVQAGGFVSLRARVTSVALDGEVHPVTGGVDLSIGGTVAAARCAEWRAGRTIRAHVTFRRPARYLDEGVPDFERDLALDGITLLASAKSGLLVEVISKGSAIQEAAAGIRAQVRRSVASRVAPHDQVSAAIVTAVLIGDRTGLPAPVRDRLQAAGTYHVIAISGGNIAILATSALALLALAGVRGRAAAVIAAAVLIGYAQVVTTGPSVWRATLMAVLYFTGRALDLRVPAWQVASVAAGVMVVVRPLDVRDPGFILTFGATVALLEGARWGRTVSARRAVLRWLFASILASASTETALLPVSAYVFSRVTAAGIVLNLIAVPLMSIVQLAGMLVVACDWLDALAWPAGLAAHLAARALVDSARLVDVAPWLTFRVPPPPLLLVLTYYLALAGALYGSSKRTRIPAALSWIAALAAIVGGWQVPTPADRPFRAALTLTMFDVGQGEALLLREASAGALLVDAGGTPFGNGAFDIGSRVVAPALWAQRVRRLDAVLVTHGDPDHLGGAGSILKDFAPRELWDGVQVPSHVPTVRLLEAAAAARIPVHSRRSGETLAFGSARISVLHPPAPDWERPRVRNDDSVVLEVRYGGVALLLTGDVGADVERAILPRLTAAPIRILKVAHHGSRTSTSQELLDHWRPQLALVSSGRGNTFGHPSPDVLRRLESIGATVFRTDRHGRITVATDGRSVQVTTFTGEER